MEKPTVAQLDESLKDLVKNWKRFALHLPGIGSSDIDIIKEDTRDDVVQQKIALYTKWLKVYPDASWDDVVKALETVEENTIAKQLRDKYLTNLKTKEEATPTLVGEADNSPISVGLSISTSESVPVSSIIEEVAIEEDVVTKLDSLEQSFSDLTYDVKREVKGAEQRNGSIEDVVFKVQQARAFRINSLQSVKTTDELFEAIYSHYNFLNCHLIIRIALFLCGIIAEKATEYKENITKFMKTTKVMCLKDELKRYQQRRFPTQRANCTFIEIKVENGWGDQPLWLVEMLVKTLFPVKHPDELPWYDIVPGSVIMTFIALEHMTSSLIESSRKKTEFMRFIGVISLKIGDELVWQRKDYKAVLSFEDSLIRATLADNIEAVQFILQYAQVDINTRNTNSTNIDLVMTSRVTGFIPSNKISDTIISFRATFTILKHDIEQVLQHMSKSSGDTTDRKFSNRQHLSDVSHYLPKSLSRRVEHYIQLFENRVKRRLLLSDFAEYSKKLDRFKKLAQVRYFVANLEQFFPTPFPGSIEVIITLHSVWSTCSVWYVEQLGQLIFTPTLFYQLQWFAVDTSEVSVKVCLLAGKELVSNLTENYLSNNYQSRSSMLGVISVQVDDTVMTVNDYISDGYTFHEAFELAKEKGDNEICNLLQQVKNLLQEMENPAVKSHYDVSSIDNNNNCYFHLHPDSTPLMIACCNDDSPLVQLLLDHNADPNIRNGRGVTALMYSTRSSKIFQMLLDHGAEHANIVTIYNESLIHFACIAGNVRIVKQFLEGSDSLLNNNMKNSFTGDTPLILASAYNHVQVVEVLLQAGANPDIQNNDGYTALMMATIYGNEEIVKQLLIANADPDIRNNRQETAAYLTNNGNIVDQLVKARANLSKYPVLLHGVITENDFDDSRYYLTEAEFYKEFNKLGITICMAIEESELMFAAEALANVVSFYGARLTDTENGYVELVQKLLEAQVDPNVQDGKGTTPLMMVYNGTGTIYYKKTLMQLLLHANANPNIRDRQRNTVFTNACHNKDIEMVDILLQAKADPNTIDGEGNPVLTNACSFQDTEIVDILLQAKANPNINDFEGNTPLIIACNKRAIEIVEKLLQAKANPNIEDGKGRTPLMIACSNDDVEIVSLLLQAGADPTIINNEGNTALDYTEEDVIMDMLFDTINN